MRKFDQLYRCHQILDSRKTPISLSDLARRLECSERTVKRYLDDLQDYWEAPLEHLPHLGWRYDSDERDRWQVPGLWMTREESQSLLLLLDILSRFGNGLMDDELRGVRSSVDRMLEKRGVSRTDLERRIRIVPVGQRTLPDHRLHHVLNALVDRNQLHIRYRDFNQKLSKRNVSPQRLVYYRDNWYLDAWCHLRDGLRIFSLARIEHCRDTDEDCAEIDDSKLDAFAKSSYGVFSGAATQTAMLRFLPRIAREIASQRWHPAQTGKWDKKDYLLTIPFSEPAELVQDILRHVPDCIVEGPDSLKHEVLGRLKQSIAHYTGEIKASRL
ncbi:MAG: helix-turn-helix transcriptional regulator [bacterium]